jgi:tetratricopeptide (TPR) repeat protein
MMLTIKKRRRALQILTVISVVSLTACGPRGPRDLRKGERLMAGGHYVEAIPILGEGVELLNGSPGVVQANAWNLLGLAYQGAGQPDAAARAYLQALKLDRNLWAADYNLGCLRMEQTNFSEAIDYLTTYTTSHPKDTNGFLLLGRARLKMAMEHSGAERDWQLDNARLDFEYAEKLHTTAEGCNALGLLALQRRVSSSERVRAAIDFFKLALQRDAHYPPALLNLAIVQQRYLNNPRQALETYRAYLALQPAPPQAKEVEKLAHQLDVSLRVSITPHVAEHPSPPPVAATNSNPPPQTPPPPVENPVPKPAPQPTVKATPAEKPAASPQHPLAPTNPPPHALAQSPTAPVAPANPSTNGAGTETAVGNPPEERKNTFAQKLNPLNWFSKSKKTNATETASGSEAVSVDRYTYPLPVTLIPGNRKQAEQLTKQGRQAEHQGNRAEAMRDYQEAVKADPTYFEAGLALGLAAIDAKDYPAALDALGQVLTVDANSADARYAFAWVLGKRGYYQDAANELDKLLSVHPQEVRAHLLLGNFYADNLDQQKLAREQYLKAMELIDPQSAQAAVLRAWLDQHP